LYISIVVGDSVIVNNHLGPQVNILGFSFLNLWHEYRRKEFYFLFFNYIFLTIWLFPVNGYLAMIKYMKRTVFIQAKFSYRNQKLKFKISWKFWKSYIVFSVVGSILLKRELLALTFKIILLLIWHVMRTINLSRYNTLSSWTQQNKTIYVIWK
jgi:hypothetical protein